MEVQTKTFEVINPINRWCESKLWGACQM